MYVGMWILELLFTVFDAVVILGLDFDFLFKWIVSYCALRWKTHDIFFFKIMKWCTTITNQSITGKWLSEALIFESTNPQYDNRLFFESPDQSMKISRSEHVVYTNCFLFCFWYSEQFMYTTCSELGIFMYWTGDSMNNLLSYCRLVEVRISASEKDIPVQIPFKH